MESELLKEIIERVSCSVGPKVELIRRARTSGNRVGVFPSSFNPLTVAHIELMRLARDQFSLDETMALAGTANADKSVYECALEDRLKMLSLALAEFEYASIGISSTAYFVDMAEALGRVYPPQTDLHFIIGFDTFERVLDFEDKYILRYHLKFSDRVEALGWLIGRSRLIVAGRRGRGERQVNAMIEREGELLRGKVRFLATPDDLTERSATEIRARVVEGRSIKGLVPEAVEEYILERKLYQQ
jgi:nicotinate-nucleotide adenylyltransferase